MDLLFDKGKALKAGFYRLCRGEGSCVDCLERIEKADRGDEIFNVRCLNHCAAFMLTFSLQDALN